jgi:hypothetical protein
MKSCSRLVATFCIVIAFGTFAPRSAFAQVQEGWQVDLARLYFWAATTDGNLAINGNRNVPVYMDFADAASKLAGAFAAHVVATNGRWGVLGDVNFIRLSSDVNYTGPIVGAPITGTMKLGQVLFNGKLMYEVKAGSKFMLVGGLRTFSMSPTAHFTDPSALGGIEFQIKPSIGLAAAYSALRIDTGNVPKSGTAAVSDVQYAVTQYGPAFSLTFHWADK